MPDLELASASSLGRPLFKTHKSLPRRRDVESNLDSVDIFSAPIENDQVKDPIVAVAPSLPLTPPNPTQDDQTETPRQQDQLSSPHSESSATPIAKSHQFSPPTPDITPPRMRDTTPKARRPPLFLDSSISSHAESFQTARESLSDEDTADSRNPSTSSLAQHPHRKPFLKPSPLANDVGSSATTPEKKPASEGFATMTSKSIPNDNTETVQQKIAPSTSTLSRKRKPKEAKHNSRARATKGNDDHATSSGESHDSLLPKSYPSSETLALEKFGAEIGWNLTGQEQKLVDRVDSWRNSAGSFNSTIEAQVIELTPQKRRTLRHTGKTTFLRSVSSPNPPSIQTSVEPTADSPHRLVHKSARIPNLKRLSAASDKSGSNSITSSNPPKQEVIPVVVIPQRRSSLQSSAPPSRSQSTARSQTSSRRNTSVSRSKAGDPLPRPKKRTMSDSLPAASMHRRADSRGRGVERPPIPARSSSLSAPTSRTNSRTTSLTSESLRQHTEAMNFALKLPEKDPVPATLPSPRIVLPDEPKDTKNFELARPPLHADDAERLRAPSLHFTQSSVVSSSPGPIEIREATTVSFFPHNNESLLLINPYMQPESRAVTALRGWGLNQPASVRTPEQSTAAVNVDSPLRYPRTPPKPPAPTADVLPIPIDEVVDHRQAGNSNSDQQRNNRFNRGFGSVRRALSARRHSDTPSAPLFRSLSIRSARSRRAAKTSDNEVHPFWQPRGFWDDFDDSGNENLAAAHPARQTSKPADEDTYVSNSLGLPQKRVIFSGPVALARRISNSRRTRRRRLPLYQQRNQDTNSRFDLAMGIARTGSPYQQHAVRFRSRLRMLMPLTVYRDFQQRLRHTRQLRAKAKLEARRQRLKKSIGPKKLADPYSIGAFSNGTPFHETNGPQL
ncbi:hypothetical protein PISL3812_05139 [Talaromyces islandicus]|uniref:Uncharacterized protein n=1 Tax=Talaromyces islandicus TaxID=28573 RepID=A0A0U1LY92_TALIS|nr:hypothetical protein PISL3812_05139 [Talaromyces islandicus]